MTSKRRSLINLLSLSYLSKSISKSLLIKIVFNSKKKDNNSNLLFKP